MHVLLLSAPSSDRLSCFRRSFFSVHTITHKPLHVAQWNFACTCSLTTAWNPKNFKVICQRSRSQDRIIRYSQLHGRAKKLVDTITHEPLHSAWWNLAWTCILTTSQTLFSFIGQRSRSFFRQWTKVNQILFTERGKNLIHNAVFHLSIAWSVPKIFTINVYNCCPKSSALLITHALPYLAWWNFAGTTARKPDNFKVMGLRSRSHEFFGVSVCVCGYPWTVLSLEQGLIILLHIIILSVLIIIYLRHPF